jgi:hypothetical protein
MDPEFAQLLVEASIDLDEIIARGGSAWIFGSRASACARAKSDWDLLIVDAHPWRHQSRQRGPSRSRLDLVYVDSDVFQRWCGSELASHVATYGKALATGHRIVPRPTEAASRKQRVVRQRAAFLDRLWGLLRPSQRANEVVRVRRDAQRAWHLTNGLAVPPTAYLDDQWIALDSTERGKVLTCCELVPGAQRPGGQTAGEILVESIEFGRERFDSE